MARELVVQFQTGEKKMIVDKICNHDDDGVRVYAIWGMGGIGKTALAQLVYNDQTVKIHFDLKCWVYVSAVFDVKRIIKAICRSEHSTLDALQESLQKKLRGNKFFIVMDDVWIENKDMADWDELYKGLSCGAKGSTVLLTTRKKDTAQWMAKNIPELQHNVEKLTDVESWSLFEKLALPGRGAGENVSKELKDVGMEIVKKCNGLPLAVKSLGSLMLTKEKEVDEWRAVNDNFKWEKDDDIVLSALKLSYDDLPPHTKICFAYCCLFLKGEVMRKDSLIELWMVNGFIPSQGYASLYEDGKKIFDCLVRRSFFQDVVEKDIDTICKMHDLMHDLARNVRKHDFAVIEPAKESITQDEVLHLSLSSKDFKFSEQNLEKLISVRSMFVYNIDYTSNITQISNHVYLRVLYLNGIESSTLPESICKLIHLRYLKISKSKIEVLPESVIYLQNLQTLILEQCVSLCELPKGLRYMRNLQRLDIGDSPYLRHMPAGIKELTNLRRLSQFAVGRDKGARIGELGNMNLVGMRKLRLSGLENVGGLREAETANLKGKTNLKTLTLDWSLGRSETYDSEVVEGLEPNSGLQELKIFSYMGRVISPRWLVKLVNLTSIHFVYLKKCEQLPPLGKLPSLKRIDLLEMGSLKCFHDDDNSTSKDEILFPSLQELDIHDCGSLVSLPNNFPKLRSLKIYECDKLRSLPDEIQSFKDLNQITIVDCAILSRRCEKGIGEDWHKISHIPRRDIRTSRFKKELEEYEQKRKEEQEAHLYTIIKVARDENLHEQIGKNIFFDLVDHEKVRSFRVRKQTSFSLFKEEVAKQLGIPVRYQRFWLWAKRQNQTYRPHHQLTPLEEAETVGHLGKVSDTTNNELKLFLEVELGQDSQLVPPPAKTKEDILLFFKLYDPIKEELRYVGRLFVKGTGKPTEILAKLNELAGLAPDEDIELFEEIKFEPYVMCEHVDKNTTFRASQLENGDIICLQKPLQARTVQCRYPDVPSFLEYVHDLIVRLNGSS